MGLLSSTLSSNMARYLGLVTVLCLVSTAWSLKCFVKTGSGNATLQDCPPGVHVCQITGGGSSVGYQGNKTCFSHPTVKNFNETGCFGLLGVYTCYCNTDGCNESREKAGTLGIILASSLLLSCLTLIVIT